MEVRATTFMNISSTNSSRFWSKSVSNFACQSDSMNAETRSSDSAQCRPATEVGRRVVATRRDRPRAVIGLASLAVVDIKAAASACLSIHSSPSFASPARSSSSQRAAQLRRGQASSVVASLAHRRKSATASSTTTPP